MQAVEIDIFVLPHSFAVEVGRDNRSVVECGVDPFAVGYAILSFQFESWLEPLIVMAAIPMSLIGMIFGHMWMGMEISMPSLVGFVSLAGIVVNDSILLGLFLKKERSKSKPSYDSARSASRLRFRATMLTSITTMAGLLPLTLEKSTQAQVLIPTAVSIVFGLLSSTILVLIVIPCVYVAASGVGLIRPDDHESSSIT
ncbi:efflux RND transporter permease subunit [Novipirellula rosea]|uniref:Cobalt-zinc-cadmium resistance protein CzcA n=1 Tax=Novipirellula rosea TaxID=1031540 RepID=A0ABP8NL45_9BACT